MGAPLRRNPVSAAPLRTRKECRHTARDGKSDSQAVGVGGLPRKSKQSGTQEPRKGISEVEGKGAQGSAERVGRRASFKRGKGFPRYKVKVAAATERGREPNEFQTASPFLASSFPDSKILSLPWWIDERSVLVRTDFTDPSQDTSATNNQIISRTYHSPFSGFSYFP